MKAVLDLLAFVDRLEDESREPICLWPNLELARIVVDDDPSERLKPPPTERHWVTGVDDDLLPLEAHGKTIRHRSSSTCPTTPGWRPSRARMEHRREDESMPGSDLPTLGAPATRALASIGITRLEQVADRSEAELLALHGFGPRALRILREALEA